MNHPAPAAWSGVVERLRRRAVQRQRLAVELSHLADQHPDDVACRRRAALAWLRSELACQVLGEHAGPETVPDDPSLVGDETIVADSVPSVELTRTDGHCRVTLSGHIDGALLDEVRERLADGDPAVEPTVRLAGATISSELFPTLLAAQERFGRDLTLARLLGLVGEPAGTLAA